MKINQKLLSTQVIITFCQYASPTLVALLFFAAYEPRKIIAGTAGSAAGSLIAYSGKFIEPVGDAMEKKDMSSANNNAAILAKTMMLLMTSIAIGFTNDGPLENITALLMGAVIATAVDRCSNQRPSL